MGKPLVTVICICFNHERFVEESIRSVLEQSYPSVELIIIDDNSADNSVTAIQKAIHKKLGIKFMANQENMGICRSFNKAFRLSKGEYIIDLAADDVLVPDRIEKGVEAFYSHPHAGVHFCDAWYIDEESKIIGQHYKRDVDGKLMEKVPQGWIYKDILERYFICPPSMMYSKKAIKRLGGYDEELVYEDFDFQVRSSREFEYIFTDELLVKKRVLHNSLSAGQYKFGSSMLRSTYKICEKAFRLNRSPEERRALKKRIFYELRQAILSGNFDVAGKFVGLLFRS